MLTCRRWKHSEPEVPALTLSICISGELEEQATCMVQRTHHVMTKSILCPKLVCITRQVGWLFNLMLTMRSCHLATRVCSQHVDSLTVNNTHNTLVSQYSNQHFVRTLTVNDTLLKARCALGQSTISCRVLWEPILSLQPT